METKEYNMGGGRKRGFTGGGGEDRWGKGGKFRGGGGGLDSLVTTAPRELL